MRPEILTAQQALRAVEREIAKQVAEAIVTLESVDAAMDAGDRAEAARLLEIVSDTEYDLTGDCEACTELEMALGLEDMMRDDAGVES